MAVGIAFVGCGYVADLYVKTLENWTSTLDLKGVYDIRADRRAKFCKHYGLREYASLEEVLSDDDVTIVVNLTNPHAHYEISRQALDAGKHVYSEKPLALKLDEAEALVQQAERVERHLVSAPSSVLGEAAQTLWSAVRRQDRGKPRLVYAELDDGLVHRLGYKNWKTETGEVWPARDEFKTGCTLEHAGYVLTWLVAMFGPVQRMVSFAQCLIPEKGPDTPEDYATPDFSCATLEFKDGVVARMTNSIIAHHDHNFRIYCDNGLLSVAETWDFSAAVRSVPVADTRLKRQAEKKLGLDFGKTLKPVRQRRLQTAKRGYQMDFALGIAEMAEAITEGRTPRLAGAFSLHITEVSLAVQHPDIYGAEYVPKSQPAPIAPMFD